MVLAGWTGSSCVSSPPANGRMRTLPPRPHSPPLAQTHFCGAAAILPARACQRAAVRPRQCLIDLVRRCVPPQWGRRWVPQRRRWGGRPVCGGSLAVAEADLLQKVRVVHLEPQAGGAGGVRNHCRSALEPACVQVLGAGAAGAQLPSLAGDVGTAVLAALTRINDIKDAREPTAACTLPSRAAWRDALCTTWIWRRSGRGGRIHIS